MCVCWTFVLKAILPPTCLQLRFAFSAYVYVLRADLNLDALASACVAFDVMVCGAAAPDPLSELESAAESSSEAKTLPVALFERLRPGPSAETWIPAIFL